MVPNRTTHHIFYMWYFAPFAAICTVQKTWKASLFQPATLIKVTLLDGCFSRFLNCTNGTKSRKASYIILSFHINHILILLQQKRILKKWLVTKRQDRERIFLYTIQILLFKINSKCQALTNWLLSNVSSRT